MDAWATANIRQREHFAAICEQERRASEPDCTCTDGYVCRHNAACPRVKVRKAKQQAEAQRLHLAGAP